MNIHRALSDIADIRAQLDRTETYRGFRSVAVGISVLVLILGALAEKKWVAQPTAQIDEYLIVWLLVAAVSSVIAFVEMLIRGRMSDNQMVWKTHWALAGQIAPSFFVAFVLTMLIASHSFEQRTEEAGMMWALPGIWSMVYSLSLFSCRKHLPIQTVYVAGYFLGVGSLILAYGWNTRELAGWEMVVSFGVGQTFLCWVLFWNLERSRGEQET